IQEDRSLAEAPFNVVFMGMGEPLHNYDAVLAAFRILVDPAGFGLSRRRITISTSGLAPAIERLAGEPGPPLLAGALKAPTDGGRSPAASRSRGCARRAAPSARRPGSRSRSSTSSSRESTTPTPIWPA